MLNFQMIKKRHRNISDFSKVKYFRGKIRSKTWQEGSLPPEDAIARHSEDFITVTCQSHLPRNMQIYLLISRHLLSFQCWVGSSTLGSLHQTPVSFFYRKATNRKSECTVLQDLIRSYMGMQEQKLTVHHHSFEKH